MVAIKKNSTFQIIIIIIRLLGYKGLRLLTISQTAFAYIQTHFFSLQTPWKIKVALIHMIANPQKLPLISVTRND